MADDLFAAVGVMVVLLFILGDMYGLSVHAVYSSVAAIPQSLLRLSLPAAGAGALVPGLLLLAALSVFYFYGDFGIGEYSAVGLVFLFILLVA